MGRRTAVALLGAAIGAACSLSGLDGLSGGTDPIEGGPEGSPDGNPAPPPPLDAPVDAVDDGALNGGCQGAVACERVFFTTHDTFATSDFGSLAGADALCERVANGAAATARVRDRPMRAWLSTAASSAFTRHVHGTKPYIRADGATLAVDFTHLVNDYPLLNTDVDETGRDIPAAGDVWTGTMKDGTSDDMLCADWTSTSALQSGLTGFTNPASIDAGPEAWTFHLDKPCNTRHHVYCIER